MTLEELLARRLQLERSLTASSAVVEFEDRRIERRSVDDLMAQLEWVNREIGNITNGAEAETGFRRVRVAVTHKDL
jgi:hypothetical protein